MTTKFSRTPRIQPTPAICRRPPIPLPPGAPIDTLMAWFEYRGPDWIEQPAAHEASATLARVDDPERLRFNGRTADQVPYAEIDLLKFADHDGWLISIVYWPASGGWIGTAAIFAGDAQHPAPPGAITTFQPLPPGAYALINLML